MMRSHRAAPISVMEGRAGGRSSPRAGVRRWKWSGPPAVDAIAVQSAAVEAGDADRVQAVVGKTVSGGQHIGLGAMLRSTTGPTMASRRRIVKAVMTAHPKSYAEELGIDLARNTPAPLYQWLIASLLFSARISAAVALKAAGALFRQGWRTPRRMAETEWDERVAVLNRSGYARYDESTARYIGETTERLIEQYAGDLRRLRDAAGRDADAERQALKAFKGIGEVGADIFFREVQVAWEETYPFADRKALNVAGKLGLGETGEELAALVDRPDLPRLLTALVRIELAGEIDRFISKTK